MNAAKLELDTQVKKMNADLTGKIETTRGSMDKMIGVKVEAVVNETMTRLEAHVKKGEREVVNPPPRPAIGAAPASSGGHGVPYSSAIGSAGVRASSKSRPCPYMGRA